MKNIPEFWTSQEKEFNVIKHCTRCRRRWQVSIQDTQEYYICPECAERRRIKTLEKKRRNENGRANHENRDAD